MVAARKRQSRLLVSDMQPVDVSVEGKGFAIKILVLNYHNVGLRILKLAILRAAFPEKREVETMNKCGEEPILNNDVPIWLLPRQEIICVVKHPAPIVGIKVVTTLPN